MKRTELTAILATILHAQAGLAIEKQKGTISADEVVARAVDRAELIIAETLKPKQQRADEREARKVAARLRRQQEAAAKYPPYDDGMAIPVPDATTKPHATKTLADFTREFYK